MDEDSLQHEWVVTHIAGGGLHSAAVTHSGSVYTWGANARGQLGLGPDAASEQALYWPHTDPNTNPTTNTNRTGPL